MTIPFGRCHSGVFCGFLTTRARRRSRDEAGAALVVAILIAALMTAVASALITTTTTETVIGGAHRASQEAFYAADAALERSIATFSLVPDWSVVLAAPPGNLAAPFDDQQPAPVAPDGRRLDLTRLLPPGSQRPAVATGGVVRSALTAHVGGSTAERPSVASCSRAWPRSRPTCWSGSPMTAAMETVTRRLMRTASSCCLWTPSGLGAPEDHRGRIARAGPGVVRLVSWKEAH